MGDDHVAVGAGRPRRRRRAMPDRERLRHVDLDVVDVVAVPDRLEEAVGEAQGEDVLRRLLAEEVVDAEDLLLAEDPLDRVVELRALREVGAERLLHDHPRAARRARAARSMRDDRRRGRGRHAQVVQQARRPPPELAPPPAPTARGEALGALAQVDVGEPRGEVAPIASSVAGVAAELVPRRPGEVAGTRRRRSSSSEVPTMRKSGISPWVERCSSPGSSLRRARSPVAPKSTMTCGSSVGTAEAAASPGSCAGTARTLRAPALNRGRSAGSCGWPGGRRSG